MPICYFLVRRTTRDDYSVRFWVLSVRAPWQNGDITRSDDVLLRLMSGITRGAQVGMLDTPLRSRGVGVAAPEYEPSFLCCCFGRFGCHFLLVYLPLLLGYLFRAESGKLYALFCFAFYVLGCLCVLQRAFSIVLL